MLTGEVTVQAELHASGLWITLPVTIARDLTLSMVFDTGSPVSAISPETKVDLEGRGLLRGADRPGTYRLSDLTADGQLLPDLEVRVMARLTRLQIDGLMGLDYLGNFEWAHFHIPTLLLTLQYPRRAVQR
jgi:hypothetical protein